jgi:hypothetical protein
MPGFIVFPIDSEVSITSVGRLDYSKIYLHYISLDGSTWATVVFGCCACLRHVWNWTFTKMAGHVITGAKFKNRNTAWVLHLCSLRRFGVGVRSCGGGWRVMGSGGRIWERPRCHFSFAYSCLGNYLSKYIWFIGVIISPFSEKVGRYCFTVRRRSVRQSEGASVGASVSPSESDISS